MFSIQVADRASGAAARRLTILAMLAGATMLAGCVTTNSPDNVVVGAIPTDYRQRHPTVIKEEPRTVELFIGSKRGTLTSAQRADVFAFAQEWRREASGGILIDLPAGTANERAAAGRHARGARHPGRRRRAGRAASQCGPITRAIRASSRRLRISYPRIAAEAGPCGLWPEDLGPAYGRQPSGKPANTGISAARRSAISPPWWKTRTTWCSRAAKRRPTPAAARTVLDKYHRGESTATIYPDADKGKISDVGQ